MITSNMYTTENDNSPKSTVLVRLQYYDLQQPREQKSLIKI